MEQGNLLSVAEREVACVPLHSVTAVGFAQFFYICFPLPKKRGIVRDQVVS